MEKVAIIQEIIKEQEKTIQDIQKSIDLYGSSSDIDEDDTIDPEDLSHQAEAKDMQLRLQQKLNSELNSLNFLKLFKDKESDKVENGALLETEKHYIYVGISMHPLKVYDKEILCVSERAPIIASLRNKKQGDEIALGDQSFKILSIR